MAVVTIPKIVKHSIENTINYVANQSKTSLSENGEKTVFCSSINCSSDPKKAISEFMNTRHRFGKGEPDGKKRLAYHYVLSLPPNVGSPEQAHYLALEFCERAWHGEYQIYLGTHLDKDHIHTHIVLNAISLDGTAYHEGKDELPRLRSISDDLCKENGMPIIVETSGKSYKNYKDWADVTQPRGEGKASNRVQKLKDDVDVSIAISGDLVDFKNNLESFGYKVKLQDKHISVLIPGMERYRRLDTIFGEAYSSYSLSLLLTGSGYTPSRYPQREFFPRPKAYVKRPKKRISYLFVSKVVYRSLPKWAKKALATERKLQERKAYLPAARPYMTTSMYEYEVKETERLCRELSLLHALDKQVKASGSVSAASDTYMNQLEELLAERKRVYRRIQRSESPTEKEALKRERDSLSNEITNLRSQIATCEELQYEAYQEQQRSEAEHEKVEEKASNQKQEMER